MSEDTRNPNNLGGKNMLEDITGMLNKITNEIVNKTQDTRDVIKMRSKINRAKDDIDETYKEIGRLYYEQCAQSENELFTELVNRIDDCHSEMQLLKKQINQLQDIKLCESCEKAVKQDMKYCPYCGILLNDKKADNNGADDEKMAGIVEGQN